MLGLYWGNGKENGNYYSILGLYWGYMGVVEKKMETTIVYWGYIGVILGIYFTKRRPKVCTLHMHRPWAKQVQDFGLSFAGPC